MLTSFSEFKFYQSFRIPVEEADNLRFLVEIEDSIGNSTYIDDAILKDVSVTGLGFSTVQKISVGTDLRISLQFKKRHIDLSATVVRAFSKSIEDERMIYGIEIDEDKRTHRFLEDFIKSFTSERLKDCLIESTLKERYTEASEGFEMFSLLLSLFKDINKFGDKEGFIENMLEEVVRILNAQRASIFLINPENNELEAIGALGVNKAELKFDYRLGIAGSVFTTGVALNIDTKRDSTRFNKEFDTKLGFSTNSIICHPIHNREDKIIGVIEVLNKRNQDRFTVDDEKTMKVLALVFSSVFHNYNPISTSSQIRRFSTPYDRKNAMIGQSPHIVSLRNTIIKLKDLEEPILIFGEKGVGKSLFSKIIHVEGQRGLNNFQVVNCANKDLKQLEAELFGPDESICCLTKNQAGSVLLKEINQLPLAFQVRLVQVLEDGGLPGGKLSFDVRILSSSSEDLGQLVESGNFNSALHQYISQIFVNMEPLRRRTQDIPLLVDYFFKVECKHAGLLLKKISDHAMKKLVNHDWPGNISELRTLIGRAVMYNPKSHIISLDNIENSTTPLFDTSIKKRKFGDIPFIDNYAIPLKHRLVLIEREMIHEEIKRHGGNKSAASKSMGISREALRKKLLIADRVLEECTDVQQKKDAA
jgi:two-component system, NtrC family, response regulator HydG